MSARKPAGTVVTFPPPGIGLGLMGVEATDPVAAEVARVARLRGNIATLRDLERLNEPAGGGQPAVSVPQPATVADTISLSQEARAAANDIAQNARETAAEERERRIEAEERAGGAFQAGQAESNNVWAKFTEITQGYQATILTLVREGHQAQVEALQQRQTDVLNSISQQVTAALAAKDAIITAREDSIKTLSGQVQTLSQRKTVEQAMADAMLSDDPANDPLVKRVRRLVGDGKSIDEINAQLMEDQANLHIERERAALDREKAEGQRKEEGDKRVGQLLDAGVGVLTDLRQHLPRLVPAVAGQKPPVQAPAGWAPEEPAQ